MDPSPYNLLIRKMHGSLSLSPHRYKNRRNFNKKWYLLFVIIRKISIVYNTKCYTVRHAITIVIIKVKLTNVIFSPFHGGGTVLLHNSFTNKFQYLSSATQNILLGSPNCSSTNSKIRF